MVWENLSLKNFLQEFVLVNLDFVIVLLVVQQCPIISQTDIFNIISN